MNHSGTQKLMLLKLDREKLCVIQDEKQPVQPVQPSLVETPGAPLHHEGLFLQIEVDEGYHPGSALEIMAARGAAPGSDANPGDRNRRAS